MSWASNNAKPYAKKRAEYDAKSGESAKKNAESARERVDAKTQPLSVVAAKSAAPGFPPSALMCGKCNTKAVVIMDGCQTC